MMRTIYEVAQLGAITMNTTAVINTNKNSSKSKAWAFPESHDIQPFYGLFFFRGKHWREGSSAVTDHRSVQCYIM